MPVCQPGVSIPERGLIADIVPGNGVVSPLCTRGSSVVSASPNECNANTESGIGVNLK